MRYLLMLLLSAIFWALNFHLAKIAMEYTTPNAAAFWRYFFGVGALAVFSYKSLPSWKQIRPQLLGIFLVGFIGLFAFNIFFFQGLKLSSAVNGALIMSLTPAITTLLAVLFQGYRTSIQQILGMMLAFVGVVYLLTRGQLSALMSLQLNLGECMFLLASIVFAAQNIWVKKYAFRLGNWNFTALTNLLCLLGFLCILPFESNSSVLDLPLRFWLAVVMMGIPGTALAYFFWNTSIGVIGPAKGAIFMNSIPLLTALLAVFFGETLSLFHLISFVFIISGLVLVQLENVKWRSALSQVKS